MATKKSDEPAEVASVKLNKLERVTFEIAIRGTAPLIVNRWTEKARNQMLEKQQTSARAKHERRDPAANFEASKYKLPDGREGFPAVGFKAAIVHAARLFTGITQVQIKQTVLVKGDERDDRGDDLVILRYGECLMREDTPRNANGTADLRYRAQYNDWATTLNVQVVQDQIDEQSLAALIDAAGIGGVGEWRPTSPKSATGSFGTFEVVTDG